jgi:hypothetical protein
MARRLSALVVILLCNPVAASAAERLAVLEFFGRPTGGFCSAAGPAMTALQDELVGQAVLLEYDYDVFDGSSILARFWATGSQAGYLPLVIVGSGYRVTSGPTQSYYDTYSGMIADELMRPPRATIEAWWRRSGGIVYGYVTLDNTSSSTLRVDESARVWIIVYEEAQLGVSNTWVRAAEAESLTSDVEPGGTVDLEIEAAAFAVANWDRAVVLVLAEDRPGGSPHRFDMAQAAIARPAALEVTPDRLVVSPTAPTRELVVDGPHVLDWSASVNADWLEVDPASGSVPERITVGYRPGLRPPGETTATVTFDAAGDGMSFTTTVEVVAVGATRRPSGRLVPDP